MFFCAVLPGLAQRGTTPLHSQRIITGQVRVDQRPAPRGVLVLLDLAVGEGEAPQGTGQLGRTVTEQGGRFVFDQLENVSRQGQALFAVSVHHPGYKDKFQIVDLRTNPRANIMIDLEADPGQGTRNVPAGGPGAAISARVPSSPEAQTELERGQQLLLEKHDPKASIQAFKKVVELDPAFAPGYVLMGTARVQIQDWEGAKSAFDKATKLNANDASSFLGLGLAFNQLQDFHGAMKPLGRSLELTDSAEAHYEIGRSFWGLGKWQEAEPHARKAIELRKDFAPAHVLMGNIFLRQRDPHSALAEFQEFLRLDADGALAPSVKEMVAKIEKGLAQR